MRQRDFDFVLKASLTAPIPLDSQAAEEVVKLMAAAILAVCNKGTGKTDDESSGERKDQD